MKRKFVVGIVIFLAALILSSPSVLAADFLVEKDNGDLRVVPPEKKWTPTDVSVSEDVLQYGDAWERAIRSPGTKVPVVTHQERAMTGAFTTTIATVIDKAVVYDESTKRVAVVENAGMTKENSFNPSLILAIIAVLVMVASNLFMAQKKDAVAAAVFALLAVFVVFAFIATFAATAFDAAFDAAAAAFIAIAAFNAVAAAFVAATTTAASVHSGNNKAYKRSSVVFYVAMTMIIVVTLFAIYV